VNLPFDSIATAANQSRDCCCARRATSTLTWQTVDVGDRYSDIELAANAGVKSVLVLSGYGRGEWEHQRDNWAMQPDLVAEDLLEAVSLICNHDLATSTAGKTFDR